MQMQLQMLGPAVTPPQKQIMTTLQRKQPTPPPPPPGAFVTSPVPETLQVADRP
jgi:hypothetical protein